VRNHRSQKWFLREIAGQGLSQEKVFTSGQNTVLSNFSGTAQFICLFFSSATCLHRSRFAPNPWQEVCLQPITRQNQFYPIQTLAGCFIHGLRAAYKKRLLVSLMQKGLSRARNPFLLLRGASAMTLIATCAANLALGADRRRFIANKSSAQQAAFH